MSVDFVLNQLSSSVVMDLCANVYSEPIVTLDTSAVAVFQVSLAAMRSVFQFQTDSPERIIDANGELPGDVNVNYKIDLADWPSLNPANAMMDSTIGGGSDGAIISGDSAGLYPSNKMLVAHDFLRYLSLQLFNTAYGVNIFNNELDLLTDLRTICGDAAAGQTWHDIVAKLTAVSINGDNADLSGETGAKFMTSASTSDGSDNICKDLFDQVAGVSPARFANLNDISPTVDGSNDGWRPFPFLADDTVSFKLTIAPAEGQEQLTGVEPIPPRSYKIKFVIVEEPTNTEVAADEAPVV